MKAAAFDYLAPETIDEAVRALAEGDGAALVLAGGQTLVPLLALRMSAPAVLVDINRLSELSGVRRVAGGLRIGAITRQNDILADPLVARHAPALAEATRWVGHHQTRNRGTLGGSLALCDPAAEYPATLLALGGRVEARSPSGVREIEADDFILGAYATALRPDELLTSVFIPDAPAGSVTVIREVAARPGDFALVGLVCAFDLNEGRVRRARISWFSMGPCAVRSPRTEQALLGRSIAELDLGEVAQQAVGETAPLDDIHATAAYRRKVGANLFRRAVGEAFSGR